MSLGTELGFRKPIASLSHESLLNIYYTSSCLKKRAAEFFRPFGLTDVQFNVMMLVSHQVEAGDGLSQAELSDMLLVNRANITSLIDRMERAGLVKRTSAAGDRRYNIIKLTDKGGELLSLVEPLYAKEFKAVMSCLKKTEQERLVGMLGKIRVELGS